MDSATKLRLKRTRKYKQLLGGRCNVCGSKKNLEFDHVDPQTKRWNISQIYDRREEVIEEELKKCQLLCKRCHCRKTAREQGKRIAQHGDLGMYTNHGCRCKPCKSINTYYYRRRRSGIL